MYFFTLELEMGCIILKSDITGGLILYEDLSFRLYIYGAGTFFFKKYNFSDNKFWC